MSEKEKLLFVGASLAGLGYATWKTMFPWIGDDVRTTRAMLKTHVQIRSNFEKNRLLLETFEETVAKFPKKPFLIFEDRKYSYEFIDNMANKIANFVSKWNLPRDSAVAMMMENEPAFVWTLLGLQKVGLVAAFINYHLKAHPLIHCIKTSGASYLIIGSGDGFIESVSEIRGDLDASLHLYVQGQFQRDIPDGFIAMDDLLIRTLPVPVCKTFREGINMLSPLCYIYTSGTTGLPKPAIVNQAKASALSIHTKTYPTQ